MSNTKRNDRPRPIGLATALMCALAGGALWCLFGLYARSDLAWFAFVVAAFVVWTLRAHGYAGRWLGALAAVTCTVLASTYALYLQAVARMASMFDLPMRTVFSRMEPAMAIDIARRDLDLAGGIVLALAIVLSGVLVLRPR